jgi:RNA polymerase sigma factor (sigma-70 family)
VTASDTHRAIVAVFRLESARLIAGLARFVRDVGVAEELAQDALVAALEQWPSAGVPENPGAWLMAAAKKRAINHLRRGKMLDRKHEELGRVADAERDDVLARLDEAVDDDIGDDLLRLVFTACHPVLPIEARVALTLRLVGGLTTEEIARAFLSTEPTIAQRIVRAKRTLAEKKIPFEVPRGDELAPRLDAVLAVVYLVFNEGYSTTAGDDLMRPGLVEDALRLGRILAGLVPGEPEVQGLVALMEITASRSNARTSATGDPVLLMDQNRALWDRVQVDRGLAALARAEASGGPRGPYVLQAAIAACHGRARTARETDWAEIAALYAELAQVAPSPVVSLNRAVAVSMADGAAAGLALLDELAGEPILRDYHLLPSARADMLAKLGREREAALEFERAASLAKNARQRARLLERARAATAPRSTIAGVATTVLAGGTSRRMGRSKAFAEIDGEPLLARALRMAARISDDVVIVAQPGQELPALEGARVVRDPIEGAGPLVGLLAGLRAAGDAWVFVTTTDAPFVAREVVARLAALRGPEDAIVAEVRGKRHVLTALYRRAPALAVAEVLVAAGERRASLLAERLATRVVGEDELLADPAVAAADPDLATFTNVNTPDDLARAVERARAIGPKRAG